MKKKNKNVEDNNNPEVNLYGIKMPNDYGMKYESRGNIFTFFIGLAVFCIGIYMVFQNTDIYTGFNLSRVLGFNPSFGLVLVPLLIGIIRLFFDGSSIWGWFLVVVGLLIIVTGILMGLRIYFHRVSLFTGIIMFGTIAAGIGLVLKGLYGKNKN